ncbi:uncharacterized protein PSFLO_03231 [Pseudozyma flocculosa]|uniref:Uncharacterized protein n=1 Tax=Pseudozyma flocculosa TaxID=84751 RepID=A0A5C3F170_9BASI|nr:uncharacterized protein PSFLO_03231 [Pseudozyma flocculosa]
MAVLGWRSRGRWSGGTAPTGADNTLCLAARQARPGQASPVLGRSSASRPAPEGQQKPAGHEAGRAGRRATLTAARLDFPPARPPPAATCPPVCQRGRQAGRAAAECPDAAFVSVGEGVEPPEQATVGPPACLRLSLLRPGAKGPASAAPSPRASFACPLFGSPLALDLAASLVRVSPAEDGQPQAADHVTPPPPAALLPV